MTLATITDVTVYSGGRWLPGTDVHLADGRVAALSAHGELPCRGEVLDGRGGHLTPGLVNTHTHLFQAGLRGTGEGLGLLAWLRAVGEEAAQLTPERAYAAAAAAAAEALRSGTTTLVEHMWPHPSPEVHDAVLRALRDSGVRAVLCRGVADRADPSRRWGFDPRLMQPLQEALAHTDELIAQARGSRVDIGVAVPNVRCLTPEGMGAVRAYAEERGLPVSLHLLETTTDDTTCRDHAGVGAVAHLERAGFLWERLLAVHCVELDAEGRATLARHGVGVSYNPLSNMRLGSGIAPVPEMLAAGLSVGLGVDGAASNDTQDILEALRIGAYLQRAAHRRADLLGFPEMFAMAAGGANRVLGIEENPDGGVRVGMRADLVLHRFDRDYACLPVRDPGATLLTCAGSRTVAAVLVGGEVLVRDGEHVRLPAHRLAAGLARWAPAVTATRTPLPAGGATATMTSTTSTAYTLDELAKESRMGGAGTETSAREIRRIDLTDFEHRKAEITEELWAAATDIGFFQLVNHGIEPATVDRAFADAAAFFALPEEAKARHALKKGLNSGWESMTQVRPSVGTPDRKESYQVTRPHMAGLWPDDALPGFRERVLAFEASCRELAMRVLSCFADRLGLPEGFFAHAHDPASPQYQSTLRMLHYFAVPEDAVVPANVWRAGAHTDFDCLTLLFQRDGQGGLQVCPGKEAEAQEWTPVEPADSVITCNIGDMLMRWSDDRLPSNFHRVRSPGPDEDRSARHSIAFFAQADRDVVIEGPEGRYPPITAADYLQQRIAANFAR